MPVPSKNLYFCISPPLRLSSFFSTVTWYCINISLHLVQWHTIYHLTTIKTTIYNNSRDITQRQKSRTSNSNLICILWIMILCQNFSVQWSSILSIICKLKWKRQTNNINVMNITNGQKDHYIPWSFKMRE